MGTGSALQSSGAALWSAGDAGSDWGAFAHFQCSR